MRRGVRHPHEAAARHHNVASAPVVVVTDNVTLLAIVLMVWSLVAVGLLERPLQGWWRRRTHRAPRGERGVAISRKRAALPPTAAVSVGRGRGTLKAKDRERFPLQPRQTN